MTLSKSDYLRYRECKKNAWIKANKPEVYARYPLSSFDQNIIDTGNEIDELARDLFPGGVLVENRGDIEYTRALMEKQTPVIYQPAFATERYYTAGDILVWNQEKKLYDLYEVKSSSASSDGEGSKRKDVEYIYDMAFQKVVLDELDISVGTISLIRLNKEYQRNGGVVLSELFDIEDYTERVAEILADVRKEMELAHGFLFQPEEPNGFCECVFKGLSGHCTTSPYSLNSLPEYPVHAIHRIGNSKAKLTELVDSGTLNIFDVPQDFFKPESKYALQVRVAQSGKPYVDSTAAEEFLEDIEYPIAFLDYETYPSAVPRFDGYKPYQQIPFQFSLHIKESPESDLVHREFLYTGTGCPDDAFVEALKESMPTEGSVIVWNKTFECSHVNKRLWERHPQHKDFLTDINDRVVDLMLAFSGNRKEGQPVVYMHPDSRGSASIKNILPVLAPDLTYKNLEIQEGGTASDTWNRITTGEYPQEEFKAKAQSLKEYCCRDTLAMVKIWEALKDV